MSNWRKIVTSGSFAELRRLDSGPISTTYETYDVVTETSLAGVNFLPNLGQAFGEDTSANFSGAPFRIRYYGKNGLTDSSLSGFNSTDAKNITDGNSSTFGAWSIPGTERFNQRYLYITFPYAINVDQWTVNYNTAGYNPGQITWQYAVTDPTLAVGTEDFQNHWTDFGSNSSAGTSTVVDNTSPTSAQYWRLIHTFDNSNSSALTAVMIMNDLLAVTNAGIAITTTTSDIEEHYALQVTGSAIVTEGINTGYIVLPSSAANITDVLAEAGSLEAGGIFMTSLLPGTLYISASKITGFNGDLSIGDNAPTLSLAGTSGPGDTSLTHVQYDLKVENTASVGYLNIGTGVSFNDVVIESATAKAVSTPLVQGSFSQTFDTDDPVAINNMAIGVDQVGGIIFDYHLRKPNAGRVGQFMMHRIGTNPNGYVYDFTDVSTRHIGIQSAATTPAFSASINDDGTLNALLVDGDLYTVTGFIKTFIE